MSSPNSIILRAAVESSCIASAGYRTETETLEIEFKSGSVYQYFHVPFEIYRRLLDAESKGRFFSRFIKTHYSGTRMSFGTV